MLAPLRQFQDEGLLARLTDNESLAAPRARDSAGASLLVRRAATARSSWDRRASGRIDAATMASRSTSQKAGCVKMTLCVPWKEPQLVHGNSAQKPVGYFSTCWGDSDAAQLGVWAGDPAHQSFWEFATIALALDL